MKKNTNRYKPCRLCKRIQFQLICQRCVRKLNPDFERSSSLRKAMREQNREKIGRYDGGGNNYG
jgi:hypothetical protein